MSFGPSLQQSGPATFLLWFTLVLCTASSLLQFRQRHTDRNRVERLAAEKLKQSKHGSPIHQWRYNNFTEHAGEAFVQKRPVHKDNQLLLHFSGLTDGVEEHCAVNMRRKPGLVTVVGKLEKLRISCIELLHDEGPARFAQKRREDVMDGATVLEHNRRINPRRTRVRHRTKDRVRVVVDLSVFGQRTLLLYSRMRCGTIYTQSDPHAPVTACNLQRNVAKAITVCAVEIGRYELYRMSYGKR
ncbi:hypothetical protein F2P81_011508 [Scophthalmus maximus]|uniref:Uncharacterized protein n=1 Tax=Scophthalmus maximus TaxID=52904 RepID=A0A6A4SLU8_SCOMX|nr:hypothetical protein F2P81_011508 [Scophthalmus maximus]